MTRDQLSAEIYWLGWRALAARTFNLRPTEAYALTVMMRAPGRVATVEALGDFDGDGLPQSRTRTPTRGSVVNWIARLRGKLADVGLTGIIETVGAGWPNPIYGYRIPTNSAARRVNQTLLQACGVDAWPVEVAA